MNQWDEMCTNYRISEENIEVIDETQVKVELESPVKIEEDPALTTTLEYNSDLAKRDYNKDEDVLSYLRGELANLEQKMFRN